MWSQNKTYESHDFNFQLQHLKNNIGTHRLLVLCLILITNTKTSLVEYGVDSIVSPPVLKKEGLSLFASQNLSYIHMAPSV